MNPRKSLKKAFLAVAAVTVLTLGIGAPVWMNNDIIATPSAPTASIPNQDSVMTISEYGEKFWRNQKGQLHRTDGPAIEFWNGEKEWYVSGRF